MNEAARVAKFITMFGSLGGSFLGRPFNLLPFQFDVIADIYAEGGDSRGRLRRSYLLGLPRKL